MTMAMKGLPPMADIIIARRHDRSNLSIVLSNSVKGSAWITENMDLNTVIGAVTVPTEVAPELADIIQKDGLEVELK